MINEYTIFILTTIYFTIFLKIILTTIFIFLKVKYIFASGIAPA